MIDVNVKGTLYAVRAALPHLLESGEADLVTIASEAGRRGLPLEAVYCASKFAQVGFTRALGPRAARAGSPVHEHLPGRGRDRLRDGPRANSRDAGARRDDERGGRGRGRSLRPDAASHAPHPRDGLPAGDGVVVGMRPVRWGIVSTAHINRLVIPPAQASEKCDLIAVASRDAARAEEYAREWGIERSYGSYEALLDDPDVEAVYISLPNSLHCEWSIRAVEAGKHVLCEKPLSRRAAEVEAAFDAADRSGRLLLEAFMWRHNPQTRKLTELVDDGAVGGAACDPLVVQLHDRGRPGQRAAALRARRRSPDGRRLLLRQRVAAARRRAAAHRGRSGARWRRGRRACSPA